MLDTLPGGMTPLGNRSMYVRLMDVDIGFEAPAGVLAVLDAMLSVVPRSRVDGADVVLTAVAKDGVWEIRGYADSLKILTGKSALPQVAGALISSAVAAAAGLRDVKALRAAVMEKGGRALAMIGDDWESASTLGAHLHGRGWRFVGTDNAFVDRTTLEVAPVQKSLYVNSSAVGAFPVRYRRALEASPWYVTPQGISFYAVDPRKAGHAETWAPSGRLAAVVVVDGAMAHQPSLESLDAASLRSERFTRTGLDWRRLSAVDLRLGGCVETCDLVDHWFESIPR